MMEVPQLHGFGPAANRLLEAYKMLLKVPLILVLQFYFYPLNEKHCEEMKFS